MKVLIGQTAFLVGWMYSTINRAEVTPAVKSKKLEEPVKVTTCFIKDPSGKVLHQESVRKFYKDCDDRNEARIRSLDKVVNAILPGKDNKNFRKAFWDTYQSRNSKQVSSPLRAV